MQACCLHVLSAGSHAQTNPWCVHITAITSLSSNSVPRGYGAALSSDIHTSCMRFGPQYLNVPGPKLRSTLSLLYIKRLKTLCFLFRFAPLVSNVAVTAGMCGRPAAMLCRCKGWQPTCMIPMGRQWQISWRLWGWVSEWLTQLWLVSEAAPMPKGRQVGSLCCQCIAYVTNVVLQHCD